MSESSELRLAVPQIFQEFAESKVDKILVQFNLGRGTVRVVGGDHSVTLAGLGPLPNVIDVTSVFRQQALAGPQELGVWHDGELIDFVRFIVRTVGGLVYFFEQALPKMADSCPGPKTRYRMRPAKPGENLAVGPSEYVGELRDRTLGGHECKDLELERARRFFIELELKTNPGLVLKGPVAQAVSQLHLPLRNRLQHRVDPSYQDGRPELLHVCTVAMLMTELIAGHFGSDLDAAGIAFERFANGELRWRLSDTQWVTQPSSGYFFLFSEFAFAAKEVYDSPLWTRMAYAMARSQEAFVAAYPRQCEGKGFDAYRGCAYNECTAMDADTKTKVRLRYAEFSWERLLEQAKVNATSAFPEWVKKAGEP